MNIKLKNIFLFTFLSLLLTGCVQDQFALWQEDGDEEGYPLSLEIEDSKIRTRDVNFTNGASLRINYVWVGIFDIASGRLVDGDQKVLNYKTVQSGEPLSNLVRARLNGPSYNGGSGFVMVCVANYLGVKDAKSGETLEDRLNSLETWKEFNELSVDFNTAYEPPHSTTTPVLAGFLNSDDFNSKNPSSVHVKLDQFWNNTDDGNGNTNADGVHLSPAKLLDNLRFKYDSTHGYYFDDGNYTPIKEKMRIFLRRMVANIQVNVTVENENLVLNEVSYKRYNVPTAAYIVERRTTDCEFTQGTDGSITISQKGDFPTLATQSPNYADLNPATGYSDDTDWQINTTKDSEKQSWHFSFQHFANKHWARDKEIKSQVEREKIRRREVGRDPETNEPIYKNEFLALTNGKGLSDFNNHASYFVIKMQLIDKTTGRATQTEYTIHEGYTSDEVGREIDQNNKNPGYYNDIYLDYSCARNINYTYNVVVQGVENIYYNVEQSVGFDPTTEIDDHWYGQGGRVWEFHYANDEENKKEGKDPCYYDYQTGMFVNAIGPDGGIFENAITIDGTNPNIAFRLYGYDSESGRIQGYNYNLSQESFQNLNTLWPPSAGDYSHYYMDYPSLEDPEGMNEKKIPQELLDGLKIREHGTTDDEHIWDIVQFMGVVYAAPGETKTFDNKKYDIIVYPTKIPKVPEAELANYVRAIYIADRNGITDQIDGCTTLVKMYAGAQYPAYFKSFEATPVYSSKQYNDWMSNWNSTHTDNNLHRIQYANSFSDIGNDSWRGAVNSIVNIAYNVTEDLGAYGFRIRLLKDSEPLNPEKNFTFTKSQLPPPENGYYIFPVNTGGMQPGIYDVEIQPIYTNPNEEQEMGGIALVAADKLRLGEMNWNFSNQPWASIRNSTLSNSTEIDRKESGTSAKMYLPENNFFLEYYGLEMALYAAKIDTFTGNLNGLHYIASFIDFTVVPDGPTKGKPFYLKFKTVKNGTLYIDFTGTNAADATTTKYMYIDVGGHRENITSYPGGNHNGSVPYYSITGVDTINGTEVMIWTDPDFTNKPSAGRFYRVWFVPNN